MFPGPDLFTEYADRTYPFIISLFIANLVFLVVGLTIAPYLARIALIPPAILVPVVSAFAVLGSYALNNSVFDIYLMIAFAVFGLLLKKLGYSLEALILGLILGPIAESGFSQGMIIGHGSPWIFFESSIAKVMWVIILLLLIPPLYAYFKQTPLVAAPKNVR
jgi:putative tricarboxylic transport membrane protein